MTTTETAPITQTKHVLYFRPADSLIRAISNGLIFAGSDDTLPMLTCVRFTFDGTTLETAATNHYQLIVETVELDPTIKHDGQPSFHFMLIRRAATSALALLKKTRRDPITLTYDRGAGTVTFGTLETSTTYQTYDGSFPAYRNVIPELGTEVAMPEISFNPGFLCDLAKVVTEEASKPAKQRRDNTITVKLYGKRKPVRIDFVEGPMVLIMPVTLPDAAA